MTNMSGEVRNTLLDALAHLERGEWEAAHKIVQSHGSPHACWLHGVVHVMEGDLGNAGYWYRRAGRPLSQDTTAEIVAIKALLNATGD